MTTIQKADKLVRYLKTTKKVDVLNTHIKSNKGGWKFLYYLTGFYNNSYFSIDITCSYQYEKEIITIVDTTENIPEIRKLLERYGLKP